jgi:superfamily II DNA or RNA helicase
MEDKFAPGSLVTARGREWVVLPTTEPDVLRVRPLTSGDGKEVGLFLPLERAGIRPASFSDPDPQRAADATGVMTLFDAARLSLRSGAAPFRSLGRISVSPRPYQFVPLIMALRLDPVRLLIADDVGVGKTIEAAMIAREMLDRGLARRLAVLCPAHLCDQWDKELREKFGIEPALIQPSRIARLERELPRQDLSIYQQYPHLIASIDFVKSGRNRDPFLRDAPDFIIVDEAHTCARPRGDGDKLQHQRYALLSALVADPSRHVLLVTATPHSGIEESFRSLLGMLSPAFDVAINAPLDREALVPHIIQRRRKDVETWLGTDTPFPKRIAEEGTYELSKEYFALYHDVLAYCRETVEAGKSLRAAQQRVRHWAAIALLRCLLSSPQAAATVLGARAERIAEDKAENATTEDVDQAYRPQVLDALGDEQTGDYAPTAPFEDADAAWTEAERQRLLRFRRRAADLAGPSADRKLTALRDVLRGLLNEGYRPIVFCRFIPTANYLETWLAQELAKDFSGLDVRAVTGEIGDDERREKIAELVASDRRVLVATDCLSEGINLQDHFDAVVHYDLPWNPNRLEQREGRVDRFGQLRPEVKTVLLYGSNNEVDQVVLDVLIRKARAIRKSLGIAVPIPAEAEQVVQAVVDNVLLRGATKGVQLKLAFTDPDVSRLHAEWDAAAARERQQRSYFGQHGIQPDEVAKEIEATDGVLGDPETVKRFLADALQRFNGALKPSDRPGVFSLIPGELRAKLATLVGDSFPLRVTFDRQKDEAALYLGRTHPLVSLVCDAVLGRAFAPEPDTRFARVGAMVTDAVKERTVLMLLRFRYLLKEQVDEFAEEVVLTGFIRRDGRLTWLAPLDQAARALTDRARPTANLPDADKREHIGWALQFLKSDPAWFDTLKAWRVGELQAAHSRLRKLTKAPKLTVEPRMPPDILGCFVLVPAGGRR